MDLSGGFKLTMVFLFLLLSSTSFGQQKSNDELFNQAREFAFNEKRPEAIEICKEILANKPDYHDARLLMGRIHAWEKRFEDARIAFLYVIETKPKYKDAYNAIADAELWSGNPNDALKYVDLGLLNYPNDEDLLYKKIVILKKLEKNKEAVIFAEKLLEINPTHIEAEDLYKSLKQLNRVNFLSIDHSIQTFNKIYSDIKLSSLSYKRKTSIGTVIGNINYGDKFNRTGFQYEVDMYPRIRKGTYAYLNYGYSDSVRVFPKNRVGFEIYQKLPKSFEFSAGFRFLEFTSSKALIYTGSLSKYYGNYWFSIKPFFAPKAVSFSRSVQVFARRYFNAPKTFIELRLGAGSSPDQDLGTGANDSSALIFFKGYNGAVTYYHNIGQRINMNYSVQYRSEETQFKAGNFVNSMQFSAGMQYQF